MPLARVIAVSVFFALVLNAAADTVTLSPTRDNTLYETEDGSRSNGAGAHFVVGRTGEDKLRRGGLAFDVAGAVPAGATITSAQLTLNMSRTIAGPVTVGLHRLSADWGEGDSNADGQDGKGAPSEPGDATWIHTFYDTDQWASAGGDFESAPSAEQVVDQNGHYTWGSTEAMVADVQVWLDQPGTSFGWIVIGDESTGTTAKLFDSREIDEPENRPVLTIDYVSPPCAGDVRGDSNCDGGVDFNDIDCFVAALIGEESWTSCAGDVTCDYVCVNDVNQDASVDFNDIDGFVECLIEGGCP
jgi:hypothetical protein